MKYSLQQIMRSENAFWDFITSGKLNPKDIKPRKEGRLFGPRSDQHQI